MTEGFNVKNAVTEIGKNLSYGVDTTFESTLQMAAGNYTKKASN